MPDRREEMYGEALGPDALARQRQAAIDYWPCCGEHRSDPHHEMCKNYVADAPPPEIEGQESLL